MTTVLLPDHTQLPQTDGTIVENFQEHPQSILLTSAIFPILQQLHPDNQFTIGQDSAIYWTFRPKDPLSGCLAPDWFYVPGVPPTLNGTFRRSYVLWQEKVIPLIAIEFVSGTGKEERDRTPATKTTKGGKFWVYEQGIKIPYYAIYEVTKARVEVYHLQNDRYVEQERDALGHYYIPEMGVSLGIWEGVYQNAELPWLRWHDRYGSVIPTPEERSFLLSQQVKAERQRAERLAERLKLLGVDPDTI